MRILSFDKEDGVAKLKVETELDLWQLQQLIKKDDFVKSKTIRQLFVQRESGREKGKRELVLLAVKTEKTDFDNNKHELRVHGKIVEAPNEIQRGVYHTIEIKTGTVLEITKKWTQEELERLKRSQIKMQVLKDEKILEDFFMHLNKNDRLVTYGFDQVKIAGNHGAVKVLLVSEEKIREKEFEDLVKLVESKSGEVKLVAKGNLSQKFKSTYQIGAILRYPIE
ncbi:MAG: pelota family protein [Candidatus Aenigmarchaeota archaeon]|nr:pelota family protein [Candidatus Aenigmarchaeota archaeon]